MLISTNRFLRFVRKSGFFRPKEKFIDSRDSDPNVRVSHNALLDVPIIVHRRELKNFVNAPRKLSFISKPI